MPVADLTMNMIEFSDDASNSEGRQIPQLTASNPGIAAIEAQGAFFETSRISIESDPRKRPDYRANRRLIWRRR